MTFGGQVMKLLDILLLPENLYKKISGKRITLYTGFIFVGIVDLVLYRLSTGLSDFFIDKDTNVLTSNIIILLLFIIIIGVLDVSFFSIPVHDVINYFKKQKESQKESQSDKVPDNNLRIKIMKIYIIAHFIIVPVNMIIDYIFKNFGDQNNFIILSIAAFLIVIVLIWFNAIITRGISVIFEFGHGFKLIIYIIVFIWNFLLGKAINYSLDTWIMKLFK
jgi:hypothetical protein